MSIDRSVRFIGTQYYRHPNPPFEDWDRDLSLIRDSGLEVVRTWLYWLRTNPAPDRWEFGDYDRFVEAAARHGLQVLIQLIPECAPQWLIHQYPEARLRHVGDRPEVPKPVGMAMVGGYPGLSPDAPEARNRIAEFITRTAERYHELSHLAAIDVWNEVMPYYTFPTMTYHPATQEKYRHWLQNRYGTIDALNEAFGGWRYTDFSQVTALPYSDYVDEQHWHCFMREWITGQLAWRCHLVKEVDPSIPVAMHGPGSLEHLTMAPFDCWGLAEQVDIFGCSDYEEDYYKSAAYLCGIASAAGGKPWWLSEQTGGRVWGLYGHAVRTPEFLEQKMLTAMSYGAQANLCWQWRPERVGTESPNFGVTNEDGSPNAGTQIISRLAHSLDRHTDEWGQFRLDPADVGLVIDWRVRSWEWVAFREAGKAGDPEVLGYFRALTDLGAGVEFIDLERMAAQGIPDRYKLLILPLCIQDTGRLQEVLREFVRKGGTLVAGPYFLIYAENQFVSAMIPPVPMQELFGSRRNRLSYPLQQAPGFQPTQVTFVPEATGLPVVAKGQHVVEIYDCDAAVPILQQGCETAGTVNAFGKGRAIRVGTMLGKAYDRQTNDGLARWLDRILGEAGCQRFPLGTGRAVVRQARSGNDRLLFVSNTADEPTCTWVRLGQGNLATNLTTDETVAAGQDGLLRLSLAARQCVVLKVKG
jgi:beta-galactosidase GanA